MCRSADATPRESSGPLDPRPQSPQPAEFSGNAGRRRTRRNDRAGVLLEPSSRTQMSCPVSPQFAACCEMGRHMTIKSPLTGVALTEFAFFAICCPGRTETVTVTTSDGPPVLASPATDQPSMDGALVSSATKESVNGATDPATLLAVSNDRIGDAARDAPTPAADDPPESAAKAVPERHHPVRGGGNFGSLNGTRRNGRRPEFLSRRSLADALLLRGRTDSVWRRPEEAPVPYGCSFIRLNFETCSVMARSTGSRSILEAP